MTILVCLAFDVGTTGVKAALVSQAGEVIASATREYPTETADGGVVEQDANLWWQAAAAAATEITAGHAVSAIVVTGQMQDLILIDGEGMPLRPVILYSDTRARAEADTVAARLGAHRLTQLTGNEQGASGLLAKLRWLHVHEPATLAKARHLLLGAADWLVLRTTGIAATDTTTASTTGLMELATRRWLILQRGAHISDNLALAVGANIALLLPKLVNGGARVGTLTVAAADALGVAAGIPVHLAPGDAGAATLGASAGESGISYAYIGTSGWVAYTSEQRGDPARGVFTLAHPDPARYICVAPLLTAGGNLDWVQSVFGAESHDALIENAIEGSPGAKLVYLPYLNGERSPFSDPQASGAFIGLRAHHTQADMARAVLEGVAFAYRHALEALMPTPVARLMMAGGGTRSLAWCQLFADVIGVVLDVAADAQNVGVRGAVLAAQVARGEQASYAPAGVVPVRATLTPNAEMRAHYDHLFSIYKAAYPALQDVLQRL
ncbi:MAG: FGGY family carbohydrate kinase [Chloroflexota bacterium]|nr:FGGY family carbohydrate kinase [Chloroflexota bacterium]